MFTLTFILPGAFTTNHQAERLSNCVTHLPPCPPSPGHIIGKAVPNLNDSGKPMWWPSVSLIANSAFAEIWRRQLYLFSRLWPRIRALVQPSVRILPSSNHTFYPC